MAGRASMSCVGLGSLLCVAVMLMSSTYGAQEQGVVPPVVLEGRVEIPSQFDDGATIRLLELGMEALGIELQGRVELSSITPPAGRMVVDSLVGDPQRVMAFISGWFSLPERLTWHAAIDSLRIEDLVLSFGTQPLSMTIARISWHDGELGPLALATKQGGEWSIDLPRISSKFMPIVFPGLGIPELTDLLATGLRVQGRPGQLSVEVDHLEAQGSAIKEIALVRHKAARGRDSVLWRSEVSSLRIDLERLWPWVLRWPKAAAWQQGIREAQALVSLHAQGELRLSSLELDAQQLLGDGGGWILDGARADMHATGVGIVGRHHDDGNVLLWPTISEAKARLKLQPEQLELEPVSLHATDSGGGELKLQAHLFWPADLQRMRIDFASHDMSWAGYRLDGELGWRAGEQMPVDLKVSGPRGLGLALHGRTQLWGDHEEPGMDIILTEVNVDLPARSFSTDTESKKHRQIASDRPLLPSGASRSPFPFRIQADRVQVARWPALSKFILRSLSSQGSAERDQNPAALGFRGQWCDIDLSGEMAADRQGEIGMQLEGQIRDVAFSSLVACSLAVSGQQAPPVYIEGRTTGRLLAAAHGFSSAQIQDSMTADLALTLRQGRIMRLSNIDARLGVMLDILSLAGLNPTELRDTLPLDSLTLRLRQRGKSLAIEPIVFRSPLLRIDGALTSDLGVERPFIELDLHVEAKGISKHLRERINLEGEADAEDKSS